MLLTQLTFVTGADNRPLTDDDIAMAKSSLTYDNEREKRYTRCARGWAITLFTTGVLLVGIGFQLTGLFPGYALFMLGIFGMMAGWIAGTAFWRPSIRFQRRMRNFLIQEPVRIFKLAGEDKLWARGYWDYLVGSIPDPTASEDKLFGWKLLTKEMTRRTTVGEVLNGMIVEELTLTLPRLENELMDREYASGQDVPDLGTFWSRRAQEFGVELYETYLAFYPERATVSN